eukprot:gb/GEZN01019549.1/.p3 GENE.gb/GEZN01019549.1/~~gb/GEZN01019549.1/.p3  ORF type:complete len:105 (+),score=15.99 gb/GEZN01019549.1/:361-675(+)
MLASTASAPCSPLSSSPLSSCLSSSWSGEILPLALVKQKTVLLIAHTMRRRCAFTVRLLGFYYNYFSLSTGYATSILKQLLCFDAFKSYGRGGPLVAFQYPSAF